MNKRIKKKFSQRAWLRHYRDVEKLTIAQMEDVQITWTDGRTQVFGAGKLMRPRDRRGPRMPMFATLTYGYKMNMEGE